MKKAKGSRHCIVKLKSESVNEQMFLVRGTERTPPFSV